MSVFNQMFRPAPSFKEKDLPDKAGKVFIVTGGAVGVGFELVKMLYQKNGTVYIATRSIEKIDHAIKSVQALYPTSKGRLESLVLDLANLASIKPAVNQFLSKEKSLDVVFHNAGVMATPVDAKTAQGHELQLGTNTIGPFLLTRLLEPILITTAQNSTPGDVRIVWVASLMSLRTATARGGVVWDDKENRPSLLTDSTGNYMQSKSGLVFLAHEYAQRLSKDGIISVSLNPGLMKTELQRHMPAIARGVMRVVFKDAKHGAYSELYAGFSPEVKLELQGGYLIPWGRVGVLPPHLAVGLKSGKDGGKPESAIFWKWCEEATRNFQT